jgi:3-demethylubiquinone-9 3-methyltransferase
MTDRALVTCCGWLKDRYGLCWQIVPAVFFEMIADPDSAKAARVTQATMGHDQVRHRRAGEGLRWPLTLVSFRYQAVEPVVARARGDRYGEP